MKKYFIVSLLLALSATAFSQNRPPINAMSFNIRYDNPEDGDQNWHKRKENVIRMLNFYDLDIIGMQEVLVSQLNYLKENMSGYGVVGVGRNDGIDQGEFTPVFYRKDRFKQLDGKTFWLSETPDKVSKGWDANLERIATWVVLQEKNTNKEIFVINTHFDHRGKQARIESARLLKSKIAALAQGRPVILAGDFNSVPDSEAIQLLTDINDDNSLKDSKQSAIIKYGPDWTSGGFDTRPFEQRRIIDYIFLKGISTVNRYAVFTEKLNEICLSDHCPVFVQLKL
jgi:endonuclease/exonuclease/phosphatase family metal-dependent hydrolase